MKGSGIRWILAVAGFENSSSLMMSLYVLCWEVYYVEEYDIICWNYQCYGRVF